MGNGNKFFRKTMGMEFIKRANWTSSRLQCMMTGPCGGVDPLQKGKRNYRYSGSR
jgi:hypothetical protein